jgi:hypothetical protein
LLLRDDGDGGTTKLSLTTSSVPSAEGGDRDRDGSGGSGQLQQILACDRRCLRLFFNDDGGCRFCRRGGGEGDGGWIESWEEIEGTLDRFENDAAGSRELKHRLKSELW